MYAEGRRRVDLFREVLDQLHRLAEIIDVITEHVSFEQLVEDRIEAEQVNATAFNLDL